MASANANLAPSTPGYFVTVTLDGDKRIIAEGMTRFQEAYDFYWWASGDSVFDNEPETAIELRVMHLNLLA